MRNYFLPFLADITLVFLSGCVASENDQGVEKVEEPKELEPKISGIKITEVAQINWSKFSQSDRGTL